MVGHDGVCSVLEGEEGRIQVLQQGGVGVDVIHRRWTAIHQEEGGIALRRQCVSCELQGAV